MAMCVLHDDIGLEDFTVRDGEQDDCVVCDRADREDHQRVPVSTFMRMERPSFR